MLRRIAPSVRLFDPFSFTDLIASFVKERTPGTPLKSPDQNIESPIRGEIYSVERLEEYATYLAGQLKVSDNPKVIQTLLPRMRENGTKLLASYRALTKAIHKKENIPPAAEWLTDNFHIVEDQIREIQEDLPPSY